MVHNVLGSPHGLWAAGSGTHERFIPPRLSIPSCRSSHTALAEPSRRWHSPEALEPDAPVQRLRPDVFSAQQLPAEGTAHSRYHVKEQLQGGLAVAAQSVAAAALGALLLLSAPAAQAEESTILRFPASNNPSIFAAQKTLVEAWTIIQEAFVDGRFGGADWEQALSEALISAYQAPNYDKAYAEISTMLARLGDPFTRIVPAQEYADFRVSSDGEVQGVGLLIAADPANGKLVVLAPITGGPADRAGIKPGDEVLSIDGRSTDGWDGDRAAKFLRGRSGSSVTVKFARRSLQIPGVAGRPEQPPRIDLQQVNLKREKLELTPVYSTAMEHDGHKLGYIRLVNFSQKAALDMQHAIDNLQDDGAEAFILDLRNNPGGLVRAGLDIARLWMEGPTAIFHVQGRIGASAASNMMQRVVLDDGSAETQRPLTVLINGGSASASEILAGALHDAGRASLVGDRTFGKGKIQSVFELRDGSALFVTVARYKTPNMAEIDQVGIQPDSACLINAAGQDAQQAAGGMPIDKEAAATIAFQLESDSCVLTAESLLKSQLTALQAPPLKSNPLLDPLAASKR